MIPAKGKLFLFFVAFILINTVLAAQPKDSLLHSVMVRLQHLQSKTDKPFPKGLFPTYRQYNKNRFEAKADNNVFTTAVIVFMLKQMRPKLSEADKIICDSITQRAYPSFAKFKNQKGRNTYNFWQTDTINIFPNLGWPNLIISSKALPDDLDDTVMLLLALGVDGKTAEEVHELMQQYVNTKVKTVHNTFKDLKYIKAYSTWFGKKMPVDFDVCVMSNVLYFTKKYHIPFNAADSASLDYITTVLEKRYHITAPDYVAPHYATTPIVLYHVSRLMANSEPISALEKYRPQLIEDAKTCYAKAKNIPEKIILQTALMRLGNKGFAPVEINGNALFEEIEENNFIYFIANMASYFRNPFKDVVGDMAIVKFNYYCPAYNDALFLENLMMAVE